MAWNNHVLHRALGNPGVGYLVVAFSCNLFLKEEVFAVASIDVAFWTSFDVLPGFWGLSPCFAFLS